jgi:two-component system, chemotaxis family, chemotaxis protein CheY
MEEYMRVLIVEDDFASRRMMQKLLANYDADVVIDGIEAVEAFRIAWEEGKPYSLVFMDIMMPRMDGQEALKKIRAIETEMGVKPIDEVRVIMTTVLEDPKNVVEAYHKGGATSYLIKPISKDKLKAEMERLGYSL